MTGNELATYSGIGNVFAVAAIIGLACVVHRQGARLVTLTARLANAERRAGDVSFALHHTLADGDEIEADLEDLRDENVRLLRSAVEGEAS